MSVSEDSEESWEPWWSARLSAMESILGESDDIVGHATIPFFIGADLGGATDIVYFRHHVPGIVAATCDLIGDDDQKPNSLGNYELAICQRDDVSWGANVIGRLAYYTLEAVVEPGETMDMDSLVPEGSTISAFLFADFGRFVVRGRRAGILLCLGITPDELVACREGRRSDVEAALKNAGVYPFTDLHRKSVLGAG